MYEKPYFKPTYSQLYLLAVVVYISSQCRPTEWRQLGAVNMHMHTIELTKTDVKHNFIPCIHATTTDWNQWMTYQQYLWLVILQIKFAGGIYDIPGVRFTLTLERRPLYYLLNIIIPSVVLAALSALNFAVPVDSGEKLTLGISILLAFSVFILILQDNTPQADSPLLGKRDEFVHNHLQQLNVSTLIPQWLKSANHVAMPLSPG